jgi:hypothetical protein
VTIRAVGLRHPFSSAPPTRRKPHETLFGTAGACREYGVRKLRIADNGGNLGKGPLGSVHRMRSPVAAREEVFGASFERLRTWNKEPKGIGQPTNHVERETDGEGILNLLA